MSQDVTRARMSADRIDIRHPDGTRESLKDGVYRLKSSDEDLRRVATGDDVARLMEIGAGAEIQTRLLADGAEWKLTLRVLKVSWPDGAEEELKGDLYKTRDVEGVETERPATSDDVSRLLALREADLGARGGEEEGERPEVERGGRRDDDLEGDDGDDAFAGGGGDDRIRGGGGDDDLAGGAGRDRLFGGEGDDTLSGGADDDRLRGDAGVDTLSGGEGRDRLDGGDDGDLLLGEAGDDRLDGDMGDDQLFGGEGNDRLKGGQGDDVLNGGAGDDRLWGNAGADRFVFAAGDGEDRIHDFDVAEDSLDLTAFGFGEAFDPLSLATEAGGGVRLTLDETTSLRLDISIEALSEAEILV
ncbi:calcium-binding protein [uncultured Albimonas sp.]|uniref:calcium-binding protein n=1 Tax=uncultured Albimonas sp. TaxID=1331701 RepID=UPI0030ECC21B|tara:strand:+ start:3903 stop:4976 length:1074 start_codon:yes stop_codon:yes gene_type:complete